MSPKEGNLSKSKKKKTKVEERILIGKKQSVYLDDDLLALIYNELQSLWNKGYHEISVGAIIKKRLRDAYGIPGTVKNGK